MQYYISNLLLAVAIVALCGCGQTGPLYMPPENTPAPPAMPAPDASVSAQPAAEPSATEDVGPPRSAAP